MSQPGPCCICGDTNYQLSLGGPTICPACDCGASTDPRVARNLRAEITRLRTENIELRDKLDRIAAGQFTRL